MRWMLLVTLGCCLYSLVLAAPQDSHTYAEYENNIVKELHSTDNIPEASNQHVEISSKEPSADVSLQSQTDQHESESTKYSQEIATGRGTVSETMPDLQQSSTPKEGSEVTTAKQTDSEKPSGEVGAETAVTNKPIEVNTQPSTTKKPVRATTVKPLAEQSTATTPAATLSTTTAPTRRYPCRCGGGICACCTGLILENFNVPIRSRACANITYEPEDFAFNFKLLYNNRLLYNRRMSAKNPPPACIPINRYFGVKMCAKLTNVYMSGRNIHACLEMEGYWDDESAFKYPFNCFRMGSNGVAIVHPEDGGGLPPPPDEEEQTEEDYDDNARGWIGDVEVIQN